VPYTRIVYNSERMAEKRRQDAGNGFALAGKASPTFTLGGLGVITRPVDIGADTKGLLLAAAADVPWAYYSGSGKYRQNATSEGHLAHRTATSPTGRRFYIASLYVDRDLRSQLSGWSAVRETCWRQADDALLLRRVAIYALHGWRRTPTTSFRDPRAGTHAFMITLIVAEIGAWLSLEAFLDRQVF